ncbi:MAG: aldo/keto reductase [Clostridiales bacterium]|jgi:predicted aldo/keto reductase-like oxidoreductase|nr:aldo/keto reductase [Clostridiales bacterium]
MEKRTMCGESVSLLGFGCMRFPTADKKIDFAKTEQMIDEAISKGVNYFDTAYPYHGGKSETVVGEILKKYPRESFYLATKYPPWMLNAPKDLDEIFNTQLKRLQTGYIDFYLIHSLERGNMDKIKQMKVYEHFAKLKDSGKIRHLGFSFHDTPDILEGILEYKQWDFAQVQFNYLDWSYLNAEKCYELLNAHNVPLVVMEPVRGGFLANPAPHVTEFINKGGITPAALALKWAAQFENVKVVLSGMSSPQQVAENLALFGNYTKITQKENDLATEAVKMITEIKNIPCTACRYCMECPNGVDIPELFKVYNHLKAVNDNFRTGITYRNYFGESRKPENCTSCGLCAPKCPQHIDIPKELAMVKDTLNSI